MIYVHLWKEKSRIYGFLVWPNLRCMPQSWSDAVSLRRHAENCPPRTLSCSLFFFFVLTNQLYHILSLSFLGFFALPLLHRITYVYTSPSTTPSLLQSSHTFPFSYCLLTFSLSSSIRTSALNRLHI